MTPQHRFDDLLGGGGGGMELWRCSRCGRTAFPAVWGGFWPSLTRYVPFCGRWRCRAAGETP